MAGSANTSRIRFFSSKEAAWLVFVAILYFAAARLSLLLALEGSNASPVWPPSGIGLAAMLLGGYRAGPAVFLGALFANVVALSGIGADPAYYIAASVVTAAGNMLEGVIGMYLLRRYAGAGNPFENILGLVKFIALGCLAATMVSASLGVLSFCFITGSWGMFPSMWITWWLGDAMGIIIVTPAILLASQRKGLTFPHSRRIEACGVFVLLAVSTALIFQLSYHLQFLIIPILIWIGFRFGRLAAAGAVVLVSGIAVTSTVAGAGPVTELPMNTAFLYLQSFIGVAAVVTLCISVLAYNQRRSEKQRMAVLKQMYDIIDFLPDATFAIDREGKVIAWNRAMETLSGISKHDMIGKGDYAYALPFFGEARPILIDLVMKSADAALESTYDYFNRQKSTVFAERYNSLLERHLAGAASVLIDDDGKIFGAIESIRDISDRKIAELALQHYKENLEEMVKLRSASLQEANDRLLREIEERDRAEKALKGSEKKYRDLVESANSIILRWKPDGTVGFFNRYALEFFGFTEDEIIGRNVMGTIVPAVDSSGRDLAALMEELVKDPESHVFNENENTRKNGERVWIAWTNRPIFDDGGVLTEILSVGNDISARKRMEESLHDAMKELAVAKEQAEAADRIKSAFLATMSHELRTPLNSIIGFTGIILQGLTGPLNAEQEKQLGMVRSSAQHLLSLINDVLDISKIEAGQLQVHLESFDVRPALDRAVAAMRPLADKKGLALNVSVGYDIGSAFGDQRRVEQVLLNLISNAVKFTDAGRVAVSVAADPDNPAGPAVLFRVADTGIGISPDDMKGLFQPFRQIDTGLTRKSEGTGLGLAICRKLAELMNGDVFAESEPGRGSVFTFMLPMQGAVTRE